MARSMMKSMCVPYEFWGESVTTAVYILNQAPTKSVAGMTPYEAWHRRKPKVDHFRTFGCLVHVKVTKPYSSKLDDRSSLMVFIGYEKGSKAYRVYNPVTKRVQVTRDAIFEEDKAWDWNFGESRTNVEIGDRSRVLHELHEQHGEQGNKYQFESEDVGQQIPEHGHGSVESENHEEVEDSHGTPVRFRSLEEIYSETEPIELNFSDMVLIGMEEPTSFSDAAKDKNWLCAMEEEIKAIQDSKTWSLVEPSPGQKIIGLK